MFRTEIPSVPGPTSSGRPAVKLPGGPAKPPALGALSRSFEESLLRRLKTLDPPAPSLSWLASAVDLVSATYSDAAVLVSGLGVSGSSETPLVAAYLDHSVKVLDVCNSISSEIEKLRRRRLLIHLVLHLLRQSGARTPENIRRARESLAECRIVADRSRGSGLADSAGALIGDLVRGLGSAPRGKVSTEERALWRTIYSVGLLSAFVSGVAVAVFNGSPITMSAAAVPGEVLWAVAFEKLKTAVSGWFIGKEGRFAGELEEVELAVRGIAVALGKRKEDQGETEGVDDAVRELEKAREKYSEGLERLHNGINGFFRSVLCTRNALLRNFR